MQQLARILTFAFVCVPIRALLIWAAYAIENAQDSTTKTILVIIFGIVAIVIGLRFAWNKSRRDLGARPNLGAFGGRAFWFGYLHSFLWILFGALFLARVPYAWTVLLIDLVIGVLTLITYYSSQGRRQGTVLQTVWPDRTSSDLRAARTRGTART